MNFTNSSIFDKIIIPAFSFFNERGMVDFQATRQYIDRFNRSPIRNIILFGSTGEGVSLGIAEKIDTLRLYEEQLSQHISITLCPGLWCIKDIEMLVASGSRVERILQLPTMYYDRYDARLIRFYASLSQAIAQDIYLYHLPKNTLFRFTSQDVLAYREAHARITGIKFSQSSLPEMTAFTSLNQFSVWYGEDDAIESALEAGASGVVCQNLAADVVALEQGDDLVKVQKVVDAVRQRVQGVGRSEKMRLLKTILREQSGVDVPPFVRVPNL